MSRVVHCLLTGLLAIWTYPLAADDTDQRSDPQPTAGQSSSTQRLPGTIAPFSLPAADGSSVDFSPDPTVKFHAICFLGCECPLARVYGPRLDRMSKEYADAGVQFIGVNSNVQDSLDDLARYTAEHRISFPIGKDMDRAIAVAVGATRTPEVFVVDRAGVVRYQGRIDDQYQPGIARTTAKVHDLRDAIDQLLAGKPVRNPQVAAVGCLIALPRQQVDSPEITFCNQIIRILQKNCIECHRLGQIGPFVLDDYDEVVGWADMSLEVMDEGRMPPWHADPDVGHFANARYMPEQEKKWFRQWVDAGTPYGDPDDLPPRPEYRVGWQMSGEPDVVLKMNDKPFAVPAEGTVEYQYFVVDPGFEQDTWVRAAQVIPGNSSVVHHCIIFQRPPDSAYLKGAGMLSGYVPGQIATELPRGYAYRIVAGSQLVFQMHYTPNGMPATDLTELGLILADPDQVTHEVFVISGIDTEFEIPPGVADYEVTAKFDWFPKNGELMSITPHMHVRGKSFELFARSGQQTRRLLHVPRYDFNWQHDYDLAPPLPLADVDELSFKAVFDNSPANPTNPDPTEYVTWGDQTWEEMAVTFLRVAQPIDKQRQRPDEPTRSDEPNPLIRALQWKEATKFAEQYIAQFDQNDDQILAAHEVPKSVRAFRFRHFDLDGDGYLTRDEMAENALSRHLEATAAGSANADGRRKF